MNKKKLIGKAALLLSLPMILGAVDGLKTSYAVGEGRSVVQIKEDSTKTGRSIKNENKKVNKARYKVITWLQGLTGDKDYSIEKVIEREGKIGDLTYHEAPDLYEGFELSNGDDNKGTIASDGSTIVNLYYKRIKHSLIIMNWDDASKRFKEAKKVELKYGESTEKALSSIINDDKGKIKKGISVISKIGDKDHIHPGYPSMKNRDLILYVKSNGKQEYTTIYHNEKAQSIRKDTTFFGDGNPINYEKDDAMEIPGYTPTDPSKRKYIKPPINWEIIFYTTNTYKVMLFNRGEDVKTFDVKYGEEVGKADELLVLPKGTIEEINGEKYRFEGWYDNPEFKDTTESGENIDITKLKMPAHNMAFFAKWTALNDDTKEEEPEQQDDANSEIHKEEEKTPDKETTPPVTPEEPQNTPKDEDKPSIPEDEKEDNQDKGEDSDKEKNEDDSKENEGKEENKEESEKSEEEDEIEPEEDSDEEDSDEEHTDEEDENEDEDSDDEEEIEEDEEESEEEDDEIDEEEDEDREEDEEIESDKKDEDDHQSDQPQDNDKRNEDTSNDKEKEKNNNSDKKEPQKDDKESDKIDDQSKNNDKDESNKEDSKEDKPDSKDKDEKDTEESEDNEDAEEIEEDEEESEEEEDEETEENSKENTEENSEELESLRKAKYACLYDKLKTALDKYKLAIENLKKYKEKCIKDGESEDYIQKIDDVLEHAARLIKRGDNLLKKLDEMK